MYFGVVGGIGIALGYSGAVAGGVKWFPDKKGTATGILIGGFGLGTLVFGPIAHILINKIGWQNTFVILGFSFALIIITLSLLVLKNPPSGWKPKGWDSVSIKSTRTVEYTGIDFDTLDAIKTPEFIGMWIHYFLVISGGFAIITNITPFSIDFMQFTPAAATGLIMIFSLLNFSGRLVLGSLSDKIGRINTFSLIAMAMTLAVVIVILVKYVAVPQLLYVVVVLSGIAYGGYLALSPALVADVWGLKNFGANYGAMFTAWGFAGIWSPFVAGKIYDILGSYEVAFMIFGVQSIMGIMIARYYVKPRLKRRIAQIRETE